MGTRSMIGIENSNGAVTGIYCHWDGYPEHNGKILRDHYTTVTKINRLMKLGDLSSLGPEIGKKHKFDTFGMLKNESLAYEKRTAGWCKAYGRDRGEDGTEATLYKDVASFLADDRGQDYTYIFRKGKWECFDYKNKSIDLYKLVEETV